MSDFLDELARSLARPMARRGALRVLGGAVTAAALSGIRARPAKARTKKTCPPGEEPCEKNGLKLCMRAGGKCCWYSPEESGYTPFGLLVGCAPGAECGTAKAGDRCRCDGAYDADGICRKVCGPNITSELESTLSRVKSAFAGWSPLERAVACTALVQSPIGAVGWEVNQLGPGGREQVAGRYQPDCATCGGSLSVQVGSGCHYAGSVNYVVYGVMLSLCHDHLESRNSTLAQNYGEEAMNLYITIWKSLRRAPNLTASLDWAKAGYNGWPSGATPPPELPNCAKCPKPFTSRLTVRWLPLDRTI